LGDDEPWILPYTRVPEIKGEPGNRSGTPVETARIAREKRIVRRWFAFVCRPSHQGRKSKPNGALIFGTLDRAPLY
jgi:hypothetical protein